MNSNNNITDYMKYSNRNIVCDNIVTRAAADRVASTRLIRAYAFFYGIAAATRRAVCLSRRDDGDTAAVQRRDKNPLNQYEWKLRTYVRVCVCVCIVLKQYAVYRNII